jgi:hypothetical protein
MVKLKTISTRVDSELYDLIKEDAEIMGVSLSEYFLDALNSYLDYDDLTWNDLLDMDKGELEDLIDEYELDIDSGLFTSADTLRNEIADQLEIEEEDEEDED